MTNNIKSNKNNVTFSVLWQKYGTICIFLLLLVVLAIAKPSAIFSRSSIPQILKQSSVNILLTLGEFFAILIAGIDLSVGAIAGLVGIISAKLMVAGMSVGLALFIGLLASAFFGFVNGWLVNSTGLHPFIITIGTQSIFQGIMLVSTNSRNVFGFPVSFSNFMSGSLGFLPVPVIIALVAAVFCWFFTTKTKCGRNIYALGGNKEAAWFSGVNVKLHTLIVFIISGLCSGIAGIVLLGRLGAAAPTAGTGYETYAIAASIIGGTSFFGGKGKIFGIVIGGLIIGIINYGMTALTIPSSYQKIVMGALIIISVTIDHFVSTNK
ncbi:MAG: D-allose ABC transporter permease [Treponema sp.]|jgi:D-allose transport system permease protein|nr:D-allose ABC transporter permease [Treponema sp.]